MDIARPIALFLNLAALALCLYGLLSHPNIAGIAMALGFSGVVFAMIDYQPRWVAIAAAVFCLLLSAVCGVVGFEIWLSGDWYGTETSRLQFFAAIGLLGTVGPLLSAYVLFRMYAGTANTDEPAVEP